jgi:hypothetical protein
MGNAVSIFDADQVPAHVKEFLAENSNIIAGDSVSSLSIKGKVFSVVIGGEATKLMRQNAEGEEEPVNIFPVVILKAQERGGREFYEGAYNPEATSAPVCWSNDGIAPDPTVIGKKSSKCASCPLSVKGSKQTDNGKDAVACQTFRLLAIVPAHDLEFEPLRLKLRTTSNFDGRNKEAQAKGWYGFKNYEDMLRSKGYKDTRVLSTKLRFDPGSEWPKIQFSTGKWLSPEALMRAKEISETPAVLDLITAKYTPKTEDKPAAGSPLPDSEDDDDDATPIVLTKPTPAKTATKVVDDDDEDEDDKAMRIAKEKKAAKAEAAIAALKIKAVEEAKAKAKQDADAKAKQDADAKKASVVVEDEDDEDAVIAAAIARKKAREAAAKAPAEAPAKGAQRAPVVEEEDDEAPPTTKVTGKGGKAPATPTKPAAVSPAVAGVLGKWADDDE